jgi:hypothetical protein
MVEGFGALSNFDRSYHKTTVGLGISETEAYHQDIVAQKITNDTFSYIFTSD